MKINYYTYKDIEFKCYKCKWQGKGSETEIGELFDSVFEIDCPKCHNPVDSIGHPQVYEILEYDEDEKEKTEARGVLKKWVDDAVTEIQQKNKSTNKTSKTIEFSKGGDINPELLKQAVYSQIDFVLPVKIWEEIDTAFGECWNKEIGIRGWVNEGQIENYINEYLKKKKIIFEYSRIEEIIKITHDLFKKIGAYLDD